MTNKKHRTKNKKTIIKSSVCKHCTMTDNCNTLNDAVELHALMQDCYKLIPIRKVGIKWGRAVKFLIYGYTLIFTLVILAHRIFYDYQMTETEFLRAH